MKSTRFSVSESCLTAVVAFSSAVTASAAETTLRWKFATGQKRAFVVNQKIAMAAEVQGQKIESSFSQTTETSWQIKGVDKDGTADMVQTIDRIKFQMMAPGGKVEADTADPQDTPGPAQAVSKLFRAMIDVPFTMKVTPRGEFRDFAVPQKLVEVFRDAGPAAAMFANQDSLKNLFGNSMLLFPEAALSQGKSWKESRKMEMPFGTMAMDMKYTLESPSGSIENIGVDAKVDLVPKADTPAEIKVKSQEMKGHYTFDNMDGILKSSNVVQKMGLTLMVQDREIAQDLESTTKVELKPEGGSKK